MKVEINENAEAPAAAIAPAPQTPTQEIIFDNLKPFDVQDTQTGKKYTCAKPALLKDLNFIEMMGDTARNLVYMTMVSPLKWITHIDGEPVVMNKRREWDFLVTRVGNEGLGFLFSKFIERGIISLPSEDGDSVDMQAAAAEAKDKLKNS